MPLFLIERSFAEALQLDAAAEKELFRVNDQEGIVWLYSFLSADRKKTYCLYQASSAEAIRQAARRLNLPADSIADVTPIEPEAINIEAIQAPETSDRPAGNSE